MNQLPLPQLQRAWRTSKVSLIFLLRSLSCADQTSGSVAPRDSLFKRYYHWPRRSQPSGCSLCPTLLPRICTGCIRFINRFRQVSSLGECPGQNAAEMNQQVPGGPAGGKLVAAQRGFPHHTSALKQLYSQQLTKSRLTYVNWCRRRRGEIATW